MNGGTQGRTAEIFVTAGKGLSGASVVATIRVFTLFALIEGCVVGGLTAGSVK